MEISLLTNILITFGLSVVILLVCHQFRIPPVVGLLLTGVLAGPNGLGIVGMNHEVHMLAEIGIVLLLFTIGIEFSLAKLFQIGKTVLLGGGLQVLLSIGIVYGIGVMVGVSSGEAMFLGFLVSLSSTAIVLKSLQERGEMEAPHGRTSLAILIFQDIIVVPMMLVTPLLAGQHNDNPGTSLLAMLGKGIGVLLLFIVSARYLVPWLLYQIARTRSRELFVLSVVVICFTVAWLTSSVGLSLGLGAFLAGLIISNSDYSHQALGGILPFRDVFTSLFFVSIGMLLDLNFLLREPLLVIGAVVLVLLLKGGINAMVVRVLGHPLRTMILAGLALSQIGEFSFVLAASGVAEGLLQNDLYQLFLAVTVLTMAATPVLIAVAPKIADRLARAQDAGISEQVVMAPAEEKKKEKLHDHLIIIGFGVNGRNVARAARAASIPYIVIETNAETVRRELKNGELIFYGDASYHAVLEHAEIASANVVAVVINDPIATRAVIQVARQLNPDAYIIVRTRFVREIGALKALGASEVIPEEFETSVEVFSRIMGRYRVPREEIERFIKEVRQDEYQMFRTMSELLVFWRGRASDLPDVEISLLRVDRGSSLDGKTLGEIDLRRRYGVTLLEIRRKGHVVSNPSGDESLQADDLLAVMGPKELRDALAVICSAGDIHHLFSAAPSDTGGSHEALDVPDGGGSDGE